MNQHNFINQLSVQLELQTQENAQIKRDLTMLEIGSQVNMEQLKADMQEIRDISWKIQNTAEIHDMKKVREKLEVLENELINQQKGKYIEKLAEKITLSTQFHNVVTNIIRERALSSFEQKLTHYHATSMNRLGVIGSDCQNLGVSHRNLEQAISQLNDKLKVIEDQMGFIDQYKKETSQFLKKQYDDFSQEVTLKIKGFDSQLHQLTYNIISIQNQNLEARIEELNQWMQNLASEFQKIVLENDSKYQNRTEQTKIEFESNLKEFIESVEEKNKDTFSRRKSLSRNDSLDQKNQTQVIITKPQPNFYAIKKPDMMKLNFMVNAEQIEKFLQQERNNQQHDRLDTEKVVQYKQKFAEMLERVGEIKQIFLNYQSNLEARLSETRINRLQASSPSMMGVKSQNLFNLRIKSSRQGSVPIERRKMMNKKEYSQRNSQIFYL